MRYCLLKNLQFEFPCQNLNTFCGITIYATKNTAFLYVSMKPFCPFKLHVTGNCLHTFMYSIIYVRTHRPCSNHRYKSNNTRLETLFADSKIYEVQVLIIVSQIEGLHKFGYLGTNFTKGCEEPRQVYRMIMSYTILPKLSCTTAQQHKLGNTTKSYCICFAKPLKTYKWHCTDNSKGFMPRVATATLSPEITKWEVA